VKLLLRCDRVDINSRDNEGKTPLWWAAYWGSAISVQLLLERHDVDLQARGDIESLTPLEVALKEGEERIAELIQQRLSQGHV